ncbi:MAG: hypothetical protein ACK5WZ_00285, partial [Pseudobdellovibrionaceae bacterium]
DPNLWKSGHEVPSSNSEAESQSLWEFEKEPGPEIPDKIIPKELPVFEGSDPSALVASDLDEKMESASEKPDLLELELSDAPKSPPQKPFQGQNFPEDQKNFVHTQVINADNKTQNSQTQDNQNPEATVAVAGLSFQSNKPQFQNVRVAVGQNQGVRASGGQVFTSADASLLQADNLRIAQQRILELEKEIDDLRYENDQLGSAGDVIRQKYEELTTRNFQLEKERNDLAESFQTEIAILKGKIEFRDVELVKAKNKVDEFEQRLKQDFKKIRIREKELENRVELMKLEQSAIIKSKDEQILDLRRKVGQWEDEIEVYRAKVFEHNKTIENQQEQFKRAIRALRVAFSSLEGHGESTQENLVPLKKAE